MTEKVTLEEMLDARDRRARLQKELRDRFKTAVVSFTLNIMGPVKTFPLAKKTFEEGKRVIALELERRGLKVAAERETVAKTGCECCYAVDGKPETVKRLMAAVEEGHPLGRLFDIDVIGADGKKLSRQDLSMDERRCLLCGGPAPVCARSRAHSVDELMKKAVGMMGDYFDGRLADDIAQAAARALLYEAGASPKPGLVDRFHSGAHSDMNFFTMIDSSVSLVRYFREFAETGIRFEGGPEELLGRIRFIGRRAEDAMFEATKGVNTHKGLIFSLGILCAAAGHQLGRGRCCDTDSLLGYAGAMAVHAADDFSGVTEENAKTHGERLYALYGIKGIRGEASEGFASVRNIALPVMRKLIDRGVSLNDAGVVALLNLIANVTDTNIITRSSWEMQKKIMEQTSRLLEDTKNSVDALLKNAGLLDDFFVYRNISAGGCADLLAVSYFIVFLEEKSRGGFKR